MRKVLLVAGLVLLTGALAFAAPRKKPNGVHIQGKAHGSKVLFTNFVGAYPFWDITTGYFVDGSNFFNQVLGGGFKTGSSSVVFSDAALALGIYVTGGSIKNGKISVYLLNDGGGIPGSVIDGPLTAQYFVQQFEDGRGGGIVQFNCVTCPTLSANTNYWIVAQQPNSQVEDTWDFADSDFSSGFAFNQQGSITSGWYSVASGYTRMAWQADGN